MFLNPLMLVGLAGAAVPLLLHLLAKARYRSVDWGAMMFLEGAEGRQRHSARLRQWVLLGLRMAIVGLLALALARPVVRANWGGLGSEAPATVVIVLDRSASMGYEENGRRRMQLAREAVLQILSTLRTGDQAALVLMGEGPSAGHEQPSSDLQALAAEVEGVRSGPGTANVAEALQRAAAILDRSGAPNREIYIVGDRQALSWERGQAASRPEESHSRPTRVVVVPVGSEEADNVAVESIAVVSPPLIEGQPGELEVRLRNYGQTPRSSLPLRISTFTGVRAVRGVFLNTTVTIDANAATTLRLPIRPLPVGSQVLSAAVDTTGLTSDDRRDLAVDVLEPIRVLILSGDQRAGAFRSEADFVQVALTPFRSAGKGGRDPAVVTVQPAEQWNGDQLSGYQVVILANIAQFSSAQARALEQFVYGGGGLLIAPGNVAQVENYNQMLWRDGGGILPAQLSPATAADGAQATTVLGLRLQHPIFQFLHGRPDPLPSATIGRYFPAQERDVEGKLAEYVSGQPFLVEAQAGRGRVLLLTTALDCDWGNLPLRPFFLPFVQSMLRYLAGGTAADRNLLPGQSITLTYDLPLESRAELYTPDGQSQALTVARSGERYEVRATAEQPGVYAVNVRPTGTQALRQALDKCKQETGQYPATLAALPAAYQQLAGGIGGNWLYRVDENRQRLEALNCLDEVRHFTVQVPADESDLRPVQPQQWERLRREFGFERIEAEGRPIAPLLAGRRDGRELWLGLVAAVVALALIEMVVSRGGRMTR